MEGLDSDDMNDFVENEDEHSEHHKEDHTGLLEKQNDALMTNNFKEFFSLCKIKGLKPDLSFSKEFIQKDLSMSKQGSLTADTAELIKIDMSELAQLVSSLRNSIMGMRIKVGRIIEVIRESNTDPQESISLINLRIEILTEYWTYLSLLVIMKVNIE